jgi:hypothetical protein
MRALAAVLSCLVAFAAWPAAAHKPSDAYVMLALDDRGVVTGRWDIALRDVEYAIGLDSDRDGNITWGELRSRHDAITAYALSRIAVLADDQTCSTEVTARLVDTHSDGTYDVLGLSAQCPLAAKSYGVDYRLFADVDRLHRGLLRFEVDGVTRTAVLGPDAPTYRFDRAARPSLVEEMAAYGRQGLWHIWLGYDHVLFLIALLLPAVLRREHGRWVAVPAFAPALLEVTKLVTAFTVAHSITLAVSTLRAVEIPSAIVESSIALTIVLAAVNNLVPLVQRRLWLVALGFGFVHGLGFASGLLALGLPKPSFLSGLIAFNLGIEAGQLAVVAAVLPLLFLSRNGVAYPRFAMPLGSIAIALLGAIWLAERALGLVLLG